MKRTIVTSRIDPDGVLHLTVPLDAADANREVQVTIDPITHSPMQQEQWRRFIYATAGSVTDPTFIRHGQGEFEQREDLP